MRKNRRRLATQSEFRRLVDEWMRGEITFQQVQRELRRLGLPRDAAELEAIADRCWECGEVGHARPNCPRIECHLCGGTGHLKKSCPARASQ